MTQRAHQIGKKNKKGHSTKPQSPKYRSVGDFFFGFFLSRRGFFWAFFCPDASKKMANFGCFLNWRRRYRHHQFKTVPKSAPKFDQNRARNHPKTEAEPNQNRARTQPNPSQNRAKSQPKTEPNPSQNRVRTQPKTEPNPSNIGVGQYCRTGSELYSRTELPKVPMLILIVFLRVFLQSPFKNAFYMHFTCILHAFYKVEIGSFERG